MANEPVPSERTAPTERPTFISLVPEAGFLTDTRIRAALKTAADVTVLD
jgi:hypothetical protein